MDTWLASEGVLHSGLPRLKRPIPEFIARPSPRYYRRGNYVVLDFEIDTSHGDFGHPVWPRNQMLLACWRRHWQGESVDYHTWGDEYSMELLLSHIEQSDFLVAHNAKYELGWLKRCGLDISQVLVFDTMLAEFVMAGNSRASVSLNACCVRRGWEPKDPVTDKMMKEGINPVRIPRPWLQGRCEQDVDTTERLFLNQRRQLEDDGKMEVFMSRCLLTPVLADIEKNGMFLDAEKVIAEYEAVKAEYDRGMDDWVDAYGDLNPDSPDQLRKMIYDDLGFEIPKQRTDAGKLPTDAKTVEKLQATTPEQQKFKARYLGMNKAGTRLSKNLDFFYGAVMEDGGLFYGEFNQNRTATHRLSSKGMERLFKLFEKAKKVQFQNMPREYKPLFTARSPTAKMGEWDGSGLEFRFAGLLSRDAQILADINNPEFDPHYRSAEVIFNKTREEISKSERTAAKASTFKPLFGGFSGTAAEKRYFRSFDERYPGLRKAQEGWLNQVMHKKRVRTPWGLTFHFPYAKIEPDGYCNVKTNVYNYPIQSGATAEVIPLALVAFWHFIKAAGLEDEILIVNTIHDSVISEVEESATEEYKAFAKACWFFVYHYFEHVYGFPLEGCPLGTDITLGTHWSEGEEESYNIYQDGRIE